MDARRPKTVQRRRRWPLAVLAVLVLLAAFAGWDYRRELMAAHARVDSGSTLAQTSCGPIEYAAVGSGDPVLVIHGAGGGFDQGLAFAGPLVTAGFRVVAVSRFGYLRTALPADASAEAQADAHACLLDAIGLAQVAVIGASAGAPSAMQFALRHPERVRALVLLVPAAFVPRAGDTPSVQTPRGIAFLFDTALGSDLLYWLASRLARNAIVGSILATPPQLVATASADERARIASIIASIQPISRRRAGLLNDGVVVGSLERYPLERIAAPTLLISLADDRYGTYEAARYSAAAIPDARFVGYPSGGHVWVGHERDVQDAIASFLRGPRGGAPAPPAR